MRRDPATGLIELAPTDLGVHLECAHATTRMLEWRRGSGPGPRRGGEYEDLLARKGQAHERAYLERLRAAGREVVDIAEVDATAAADRTLAAMRAGTEVIYQGALRANGWSGRADFLERVLRASDLGDWGYEPVDAKLARAEALPHHVLQLGIYAAAIAAIQGTEPERMHIELGSGRRASIQVDEVAAYVRRAGARLRRAVDDPEPTAAYPNDHCRFCGFQADCRAGWEAADHLCRVADIRRDHVVTLGAAGITRAAELAVVDPDRAVPGLRPAMLAELSWQARLQARAVPGAPPPHEPRPPAPGRGVARLPAPSPGDLFVDLEGDPMWEPDRGLTFLWGVLGRDGERWVHDRLWGHDPDGEREAFVALVDRLIDRRRAHPDMHIYHYSPAEPGALKALALQHRVREEEVDILLRAEALVDLLPIVRQAIVVGAPSYGLKSVERLAGFARAADLGAGSDAVLAYERWRLDGAPAELDAIAAYNEEDCRATRALRDWLHANRVAGPLPEPPAALELKPPTDEQIERERLRERLTAGAAPGSARWLAGELLEYHRRELRPAWWRHFALRDMDDDDLMRDREAIAGLEPTAVPPVPVAKSLEYEMRFPSQDHALASGNVTEAGSGKGIRITAIDPDGGLVRIARGNGRAQEPLPTALLPPGPLETRCQRRALARLAASLEAGSERYPALRGILARDRPRFRGIAPGAAIQTLDLDAQCALARDLDASCLVIQGPPGTGKTYTGARLVVDLIATGHRVGVMAVSHRAIENLVSAIEVAAEEAGVAIAGARKVGSGEEVDPAATAGIRRVGTNEECCGEDLQLVAGTSWLLSRDEHDGRFDYLVIDEASQLSLADALAAGTCARNVILLGDPNQLPQVTQAAHPGGTGVSVLEHMLAGAPTVPADRGIFLSVTRRMHPAVGGFISRAFYDGRLESHPSAAAQAADAGVGIRHLEVPHSGNATSSEQEAGRIASEIECLVGTAWTDQRGETRPLAAADMMVVAPYNAQVRLLRRRLPAEVRVGTVDRFQGQEAPVVFFSMATSSGDDLPRDIAFLFSRNRLNVAISRARCLAYLVCSPRLLDARARTVEEMRLISTLCALVEEATHASATRSS